ncbi:MAG: hypothetical protein COA58_09525 [Bacteroidetes bacterium]|nr:MAG: hypothetical protein COA58_09525 [Bacteroidota bacterium]
MEITHELKINASSETIYKAVATEKGIQGWWSQNSKVGETEGSESLLKFIKEGTPVDMGFKTLVLEPNKKVVWECNAMPNPAWLGTKLITEITETENGCEVIFSHTGFEEKWKGHDAFEQTKGTWNHFVQSLEAYCETGEGQAW